MSSGSKTYNFSRNFLFVTGLIYIVNFLMDGRLAGILSLIPASVVGKMEYWRILTFPFAPGTAEGVALFAAVFFFFGSKVEQLLPKGILPAVLVLLVTMQGILLNLVFWKSSMSLAGMEGLAFFSLSLFTMNHYRSRVKFLSFPSFRGSAGALLIVSAWILAKSVNFLFYGEQVVIMAASHASFGILTALMVHLQLKFLTKISDSKKTARKINLPDPEELTLAMIANREMKKYYQQQADDVFPDEPDYELTEDKLNEILEKISVSGKESLSPDELKFLKEYSRHL